MGLDEPRNPVTAMPTVAATRVVGRRADVEVDIVGEAVIRDWEEKGREIKWKDGNRCKRFG